MRTSNSVFALLLVLVCTSAIGADPAIPDKTAADWATDPQAAMVAILAANQKLTSFVASMTTVGTWAAWGLGALGVLVGVCKFIPQLQPFTDLAWGLFSHKTAKEADDKKQVMAQGFLDVASIMRSFPKDSPLGDVIDKLEHRLPPQVVDVYRQWEASQPDRPKTDAEIAAEQNPGLSGLLSDPAKLAAVMRVLQSLFPVPPAAPGSSTSSAGAPPATQPG